MIRELHRWGASVFVKSERISTTRSVAICLRNRSAAPAGRTVRNNAAADKPHRSHPWANRNVPTYGSSLLTQGA